MIREYRTVDNVSGPLMLVRGISGVAYEELAQILLPNGESRIGKVLEVSREAALVQIFGRSTGINIEETRVKFLGRGMELGVSEGLLGRIFNGFGQPRDGGELPIPEKMVNINGSPINPFARDYPSEFIQTGISAIDGQNTLVRGQKLPIFSGAGLPHGKVAAQVARQARVLGAAERFAVVFAAMGITFEEAQFFIADFKETGAIERTVLFINLADDPAVERIATPRLALTAAEYLAFDKGMHVLVILTDMTNYCEALREISASRKEIPGRRGYPGYMYTDLASIYERAGRIKGRPGSITQIPILSMPDDDKTHPIPDLTGYITEGQIILSRDLHRQGIYPPIDILTSLSRLRDKGIGGGKTREDHANLSNQLFSAYAMGKEARELSLILGEAALSELDRVYLTVADEFENMFVKQGEYEDRSINDTLDLGWKVLVSLPEAELKRVSPEVVERFFRPARAAGAVGA